MIWSRNVELIVLHQRSRLEIAVGTVHTIVVHKVLMWQNSVLAAELPASLFLCLNPQDQEAVSQALPKSGRSRPASGAHASSLTQSQQSSSGRRKHWDINRNTFPTSLSLSPTE